MDLESDLKQYRAMKDKQMGALEHGCTHIALMMNNKLEILSKRIDKSTIKNEVIRWRS
ncbi:hypothetical protein [Carnobacterium sp. TMP28]|uniref:hypothetical protein n=1 Tax=Carnobacterium sp. TMP28 TaxID=3397060 RepID=UPI0039E1A3F3